MSSSNSIAPFGIDLGSEATFLVSSTADIVRNELGGHSSGSLVAFSGEERIIGEAAVGQANANSKNTISQLHQLLGATCDSFESLPLSKHYSFKRIQGDDGKLNIEVNFGGNDSSATEKKFNVEPIVGMFLAKLKRLAQSQLKGQGLTNEVCFAFGIPPWYGATERKALEDAATIAGFNLKKNPNDKKGVLFIETPQALARVLAKKHPIHENESNRNHLVIDVGSSHITMFCCRIYQMGFAPNGQDFEILSSQCDKAYGVSSIDAILYELMRTKAQEKLPQASNVAAPGSKAGARLLRGVDRMRKLLGTMPTAEVTIENVAEDCDVRISVGRSELADLAAPLVDQIKKMLSETIKASGVEDLANFSSVEILGGGSRMPLIQDAIMQVMQNNSLVFGQKLDSSAIAYGSALLMSSYLNHGTTPTPDAQTETVPETETEEKPTDNVEDVVKPEEGEKTDAAPDVKTTTTADEVETTKEVEPNQINFEFLSFDDSSSVEGLSSELLMQLSQEEENMYRADEALALISARKNEIESYILTMRSAPHDKHGGSINASELNKILDEAENWSYSDEAYSADVETVTSKLKDLKTQVEKLCSDYFEAVQSEKLAKEKEMEEEAKKAEMEKFENGDDDDKADKDNRRLTKTERMKKVMKHKETGTELFKDKNYVHATKHYKDALTHCTKFFDLSSTDEDEVKTVKLALYLNLAMCWTKLENLDQVFKCASDALILEPNSAKALYRRAMVYEKRKDFDKAKKDLQLANQQPGSEGDKAIATLLKRVDIQIKKEKEKEKKIYGKMFS